MLPQSHSSSERPESLMQAAQKHSTHLQILSSLFDNSPAVYLDSQKKYMFVQASNYQEITRSLKTSKEQIQELTHQLHNSELERVSVGRELEVIKETLGTAKHNETQLVSINQDITQKYDALRELYNSTSNQLRELQNSMELSRPVRQMNIEIEKETARRAVQTEWNPEQFHRQRMESEQREDEEDSPVNEEEELFLSLENKLVSFEQSFEGRLQGLEEQQRSVQKWQDENQRLQEENAELKNQLKEIDLQEQKLRIWRESVGGLVSRVESKMPRTQPQEFEMDEENPIEEVARLREELLELRGRMVEMRSSIRSVDEVMQAGEEVGDDGPVVNLVRLSQKVKALVRGLLVEVEQP